MILQALHRYYQLLQDREGDSLPGEHYSEAKVTFDIHLGQSGEVMAILPHLDAKGKSAAIKHIVPKQPKRTSGVAPFFLCDKAEYLFGSAIGMREECRDGMKTLWGTVLDLVPAKSIETQSLRQFLQTEPDVLREQIMACADGEVADSLRKGGLCVLKFTPTGRFFHRDLAIQSAWETYLSGSTHGEGKSESAMCLITGETVPESHIARLHPNLKNVVGAQTAGAALVSFNIPSFCSFGREQSYNAPVSQKAADAYGYVLNRFLADPKHKVRMNDTTVVFWAETAEEAEQEWFSRLFQDIPDGEGEEGPDEESIRARVRSAVMRIKHGQRFQDTFHDLDDKAAFYVLGLAPNAARLSVRFWYTGTLGEIGERVWQHYADIAIQGLDRSPSIKELLRELAVRGEWENIPPNMEGQMLRSILMGLPYASSVFTQIMNRIRADTGDGQINAKRAGLVKAYLLRKARMNNNKELEVQLTMTLNRESTNTPYHLGRLFACLEKTQTSALGQGINATIRDRFWGAASATPANVFPRLLNLAQHHIAKDEEWGRFNDSKIQDVMNALPEQFPKRLTLEEQGMFVLGYYHQRQELYTKKQQEQ